MSIKALYRTTSLVLIVESFLIFVPMLILGPAINWPASLRAPANVMLPLLFKQAQLVRIGYFFYLLYSLLFWVVALLTARVVANGNANPLWLRVATGFGIASTVARTLGIIRWLVPMPALATLYADPSTSAQTREAIIVVYKVLNDYAGSVGEVLGVSLFAVLWLTILSIALLRSKTLPHWLGLLGIVAALFLASSLLEMFGVDLGAFIVISVTMLQIWFLSTGVVLFIIQNNLPHG
ncbi:DUF4386 family protein [Nostoc sp. CHAB 5715]|uniref:DUF4386 family protein n=1 Tax=Nostoc sp. CHAB 5715 TaxID=2780400 RepID=UPI001E6272B2|nr:DUF4386 domain-containing protein [Nostoc sp. CHAB 5715]